MSLPGLDRWIEGEPPDTGSLRHSTLPTWQIRCGDCDWGVKAEGYAAASRCYEAWRVHVDGTGHKLKQEKWV